MATKQQTRKPAQVPDGFQPVGQNLYSKVEDDGGVFLWFDSAADLGPTSTGKSTKVASTGGNILLGGVKVGVNAYDPKPAI